MFGRKKNPAPSRKSDGGKALMAQMGFVMDVDDMVLGSPDGNDDDLEAELRALEAENEREHKSRSIKKHQNEPSKIKSAGELEKMIALSMRDLPDEDEDIEVSDTEDPDILAELNELMSDDNDDVEDDGRAGHKQQQSSSSSSSLLKMLEERHNNYREGIEASKQAGDQLKTRRLERGVKILEDLVKSVKSGRSVDESEIPPAVVVATKPKIASNVESTSFTSSTTTTQATITQATTMQATNELITSNIRQSSSPTTNAPHSQPTNLGFPLQQHQPNHPSQDLFSQSQSQQQQQSQQQRSQAQQQQPPRQQPLPPHQPQLPKPQLPSVLPRTSLPPPPLKSPNTNSPISYKEFLNLTDDKKQLILAEQCEAFKQEALKLKKEGMKEQAVHCIKTSKQFESVALALKDGKPVDFSGMPAFISSSSSSSPMLPAHNAPGSVRDSMQGSSAHPPQSPSAHLAQPASTKQTEVETVELSTEETKKLYKAPEVGGTLMEALLARLAKYKEGEEQANKEGNSNKARRMNRIVKQYEEAIKMTKNKKPYDYSELPDPPGYPPLPINNSPQQQTQQSSQQQPQQQTQQPQSSPSSPPPPKKPSPMQSQQKQMSRQASTVHSRAEQQAVFLEQRQLKFKKAAMQAKSSGDMELAKKYMRMAKGFDQMIEASKSGLPVDLSQIPTPPGEDVDGDFVLVNASDVCSDDAQEVYKKLQDELLHQIKMCETNRNMFTKLGDISSANKFERMMDGSRKDLESLKNAFQHSDPVPRFHYETRQFSVVHCCPELGDNDLEVTVVRGLNFNPPSGYSAADLHTYVRYEFPFPDTPQTGDTPAIKGTNSPEFNHVTKLEVNRKSRSFLRLLKSSKTFKMDVYYKRGFLKADKILGSVQIKLQPLEDKCIYHETYDLMEGRKAVGGKLEVKLRVRDPFVNKQVEEAREKWLVIDEFVRKVVSPVAAAAAAQQAPQAPPKRTQPLPKPSPSQQQRASPNHNYCISVLLYERDALEEKLAKYRSRMKPAEVELLKEKSNMMLKRANDLKRQVHEAGEAFIRSYISSLKQMSTAYSAEARSKASQPNNNDQVKVVLEKKALVDKEMDVLLKKLPAKK